MAMLWVSKSVSLSLLPISRICHSSPKWIPIECEWNLSFETFLKYSNFSNFASDTYYPSLKLILSFILPLLLFYIDFHILYDIPLYLRMVYDSSKDLCNLLHLSKCQLYWFLLILGVYLSLDGLNLFYLGFPLSPSNYSLWSIYFSEDLRLFSRCSISPLGIVYFALTFV
jgi:hypothetical protein